MAFKKRKFSRGRFRRRNGRRGGIRRLRRIIKRTVTRMSEVKWSTSNALTVFDGAASAFVTLTPAFPQGVDKFQRIGNKIRYKNFGLRFNLSIAALIGFPTYTPRVLRVVIFQKRVEFSVPLVPVNLDILDTNDYLSAVKGTTCRVMYDKYFVVTPINAATQLATNTGRIMKKLNFKVRNNVTFRDAGNTVPTDIKDTYFALIITDFFGGAPLQYNVAFDWNARISFVDI